MTAIKVYQDLEAVTSQKDRMDFIRAVVDEQKRSKDYRVSERMLSYKCQLLNGLKNFSEEEN